MEETLEYLLVFTCLAPIIAIVIYILVIIIVICVYLKEHMKFVMFNDNTIELQDENEIRPEDYENGDILPVPTGSPYYDRNTPNLKV